MNYPSTRKEKQLPEPTAGVGGILPRLWRTIQWDLNYNDHSMKHRIRMYCAKLRGMFIHSGKSTHTSAAAIERDLSAKTMTIKLFITALRVLDVPRVEFQVTLFHTHRPATIHSVMINLRDVTPEDLQPDVPPPTQSEDPYAFQGQSSQAEASQSVRDG